MAAPDPVRPGPPESAARSLLVAVLVCGACASLIAAAVVLLRPVQQANQERERRAHLEAMVQGLPGLADLLAQQAESGALEAVMVTLASGELAATSDETTWDVQLLAEDRERTRELSSDADLAGLGRVPVALPVYLVREGDALRLVVLPVWGAGYAGTIWGYLALDGDLETVRAIQFYAHRETPGLGAEIDAESWRQGWRGKRLRDETGALRIGVAKGALDPASPDAPYLVDGVTGATRTGRGVTNLLRFWLGPDGFGPFLGRLAAQAGQRP